MPLKRRAGRKCLCSGPVCHARAVRGLHTVAISRCHGIFLGFPLQKQRKEKKNLEKETFGRSSLAVEELTDLQDALGSVGSVSGPSGPRSEF